MSNNNVGHKEIELKEIDLKIKLETTIYNPKSACLRVSIADVTIANFDALYSHSGNIIGYQEDITGIFTEEQILYNEIVGIIFKNLDEAVEYFNNIDNVRMYLFRKRQSF